MLKKTNAKVKTLLLLLLLGFTILLSLNRHSKSGIHNYHSEIWADKAGYYVYLPALFIYNFQTEEMPVDIDKKTGDGFFIEDGKIVTKYTYGVALMQAPFFFVCHGISKLFGLNDDGFTEQYHKMINISAVFYSFFSLILLYFFLVRYLSSQTAILTLTCLYLGTNIFYYAFFETGMSHIYSLFLFSSFLYLGPFVTNGQKKYHYLFFGLVVGLIIVVRPLNVMFLPVYFIFNSFKFSEIKSNLKNYLLIIVPAVVIIVPQLIYWKYSSGSYFLYSYGQESFTNIFQPEVIKLWFSTNNGLFIYNPMILFCLIGLFFLFKESPKISISVALFFAFITYVFASWHDWAYGCSYGSRPYVEYLCLLALPLGFFIDKLKTKSALYSVVSALLIAFILFNQKLIFSYDGCWYGGVWDWPEFLNLLLSETK